MKPVIRQMNDVLKVDTYKGLLCLRERNSLYHREHELGRGL
jgi:hypothetical protein